jgi:nicotinate phosphoribosyltransferase
VSWPGKKQVFRRRAGDGRLRGDVIGLRGERLQESEPLLRKVMEGGRLTVPQAALENSRKAFQEEFARLGESVKKTRDPDIYPVEFTPELRALHEQVERRIKTVLV